MTDLLRLLNLTLFTLGERHVTLGQVLIVPLVLVVGLLLARWGANAISRRLTRRGVNADVVQLVRRGFYVAAIAVVVITTLDLLNVPLTAFAFISGAIAIGIGFGAQNIINNFISGWILMWERPIRIGDFLELGDARGTVETINTRSTNILSAVKRVKFRREEPTSRLRPACALRCGVGSHPGVAHDALRTVRPGAGRHRPACGPGGPRMRRPCRCLMNCGPGFSNWERRIAGLGATFRSPLALRRRAYASRRAGRHDRVLQSPVCTPPGGPERGHQ